MSCMPRLSPHPLALFSLKPLNERARDIVLHPPNKYLQSKLPMGGAIGLDVGFNIRSRRSRAHTVLATIGRNDADIEVTGSDISKLQCSFEINLNSRVVMLIDNSSGRTTQVSGENAMPFEYERRSRIVVVRQDLNTILGMGGVACDLIQFELIWHPDHVGNMEMVTSQACLHSSAEENPRLARTRADLITNVQESRITRMHVPRQRKPRMRYWIIGDRLGSGQFGTVYKCVDVDSGNIMAVKEIYSRQGKSLDDLTHHAVKREVEMLYNLRHPNIIDFIASRGWDGSKVAIFMGLKEGTLASLVKDGKEDPVSVANNVFPHMLKALDLLAHQGIIHRDVKPENILYVSDSASHSNGRYRFQLADFGLCNWAMNAATIVGSGPYMAPEVSQDTGQTCKLDIWSLFVTMLWTLDVGGFRQRSSRFRSMKDAQQAVSDAASTSEVVSAIRGMAVIDQHERASAAQMLLKHYNGEGLSTPRNQIAPMTVASAPRESRDLDTNAKIFTEDLIVRGTNSIDMHRYSLLIE